MQMTVRETPLCLSGPSLLVEKSLFSVVDTVTLLRARCAIDCKRRWPRTLIASHPDWERARVACHARQTSPMRPAPSGDSLGPSFAPGLKPSVAKIIDYAARRADPTILEGVSAIRKLAANGFQGDRRRIIKGAPFYNR